MKVKKNNCDSDDMDYDYKSDPKRKNYKRIKAEIKKAIANAFYNEGIEISVLTRKYHLSYSTIAHILKVNQQIQPNIQLKTDHTNQKAKQNSKVSSEIKQTSNPNQHQIVKIQAPSYTFYPFFPHWTYYSAAF